MALAAFDAPAVALPAWTSAEEIAAFVADPGQASRPAAEVVEQAGRNDQRGAGASPSRSRPASRGA